MLGSGCSSASFLSQLEKLFQGLRTCLVLAGDASANVEIVVKANQILLDMIPDIQHSDALEIQYAQLIPMFIENLGSSKAFVRKSTHKCIATYVKLSKKLEFVLLHINHTGLENSNTRTRQHSMLVIPALLSLKSISVEKGGPEVQDMLSKVVKKLKDSQEIVQKTAKKLIAELNKCYPQFFESQMVSSLKTDEERNICKAILKNDEDEFQRLLQGNSSAQTIGQSSINSSSQGPYQAMKKMQEEQKQSLAGGGSSTGLVGNNGNQQIQSSTGQGQVSYAQVFQQKNNQIQAAKELSIVGKEILQSQTGTAGNIGVSMSFGGSIVGKVKDLDKIIYEAKEESRYPKGQNNLYYGFLEESLIEALNENNQWKERTNAIEAIESKLNTVLMSPDKKMDFMPYSTPFLGFILQFIPDINFKISLTTIKIISKHPIYLQVIDKLLQMNLINFKKYYSQLVTSLIEKLADSKVIIRQAVLKCCSYIITNYKASTFAFHTMRYLQHGNWHLSVQYNKTKVTQINKDVVGNDSRKGSDSSQQHQTIPQTPPSAGGVTSQDPDQPLSLNPTLISEVCSTFHVEDKQKIQTLIVDVLALIIDKSKEKNKTIQLIQKCLGVVTEKNKDEYNQTKEQQFYALIQERLQRGNLPFINEEEGLVEFPSLTSSTKSGSNVGITNQMIKQLDESNIAQNQQQTPGGVNGAETFAQIQTKAPSASFMEGKKRQEEEKKQQVQSQQKSSVTQGQNPYFDIKTQQQDQYAQPEKIGMWLPTFTKNEQQLSTPGMNNPLRMSKDSSGQKSDYKVMDFNDTQSSVATFLNDDRVSNGASTTILSSNNKYEQSSNKSINQPRGGAQNAQFSKSPMYSEDKHKLNQDVSMSYRQMEQISQSVSSMSAEQHAFNKSPGYNSGSNNNAQSGFKMGYTPESHNSKPRHIQSKELRERLASEESAGLGFANGSNGGGYQKGKVDNDLIGGLSIQKNMSMGISGSNQNQNFGFGSRQMGETSNSNQSQQSANDKLSLLKSNSKYKQNTNSRGGQYNQQDEQESVSQFDMDRDIIDNEQYIEDPSNIQIQSKANQKINTRQQHQVYSNNVPTKGNGSGPIKATHPSTQQYMQTIQNDQVSDMGATSSTINMTPFSSKSKKPPLTQKPSAISSKAQSRAQSVDTSNQLEQEQQQEGVSGNDIYQIVEEPLPNAEMVFKQAHDQLKGGEWNKQFEACNNLKLIALFHKNFLVPSNPLCLPIIKELMKLVNSLRSQLAKNAILCITCIMENISAKDVDSMIDTILPQLLKKAADTNVFIQESADKALIQCCYTCSEAKVFSCLQQQSGIKMNAMKMKLAMCYNALIEKLGTRVLQFRDSDKLLNALASLLNEAAIEVRNMAKVGLLQLKNGCGGGVITRDLNNLLVRSITNEKLYEKVKVIMEKEDLDSISQSNNGSTRYGTSIRGSSLDARSAGYARQTPSYNNNPYMIQQNQSPIPGASSDGFGKYAGPSMMQATYMKGGVKSNATVGAGGFNMTTNTGGAGGGFKKQSFISKPVNPPTYGGGNMGR